MKQAKHVVLTARNTTDLTKEYILGIKEAFSKLRHRKFAKNWKGGFYSIETTWNGDGAHVHIHALIEAKWIDSGQLAIEWGKLVGQDFAIVKVKDARDRTYLSEVAKYVAKGSELASWTGDKLVAFIQAIADVRMFGVFGDLYKKRSEIREFLDFLQELRNRCECGCNNWRVMDEKVWEFEEIERELNAPIPPPAVIVGPELDFS
jgi:hypothetical protein